MLKIYRIVKTTDVGNENFNNKYVVVKELGNSRYMLCSNNFYKNADDSDIVFDAEDPNIITVVSDDFEVDVDYMVVEGLYEPHYDEEGNYTMLYDEYATENCNNMNRILSYVNTLNEKFATGITYPDADLMIFRTMFCANILENTTINTEDGVYDTNDLYRRVLEFYANGGTDATLQSLTLFASTYGTTSSGSCSDCGCSANSLQSSSSCGCSTTSTSTTTYSTQTCDCAKQYQDYIEATLKKMLGDTQFYEDWFNEYIYDIEIDLLSRLEESGFDLTFSNTSVYDCPSLTSKESECNYATISAYKEALGWLKAGLACENKNKIKTRGEAFGEILPYLIF